MLTSADPFVAEFDRLAQQVFGGGETVGMPIDVVRRGEELVVRLDVPGVSRDDIRLDLEKSVLTISAERHSHYAEGEQVLVQERFDGTMTRRLRVPDWIDVERVTAECADGVLTVVLPVAEQSKPRRISIRPAGSSSADTLEAAPAA